MLKNLVVVILATVAVLTVGIWAEDKANSIPAAPKQEQVAIEKVDALQIELLQTKIESLQKDLQLLAGRLCLDAKFTRESCRVNTAAGIITGTRIEPVTQKEVAKVPDKK